MGAPKDERRFVAVVGLGRVFVVEGRTIGTRR